MKRYPDDLVATDLNRKMVLVTGPRQGGKTTLCRHEPWPAGCANKFPGAEAIQLVGDLRQEECRASVRITDAANWLAGLEA